MTEALAKPLTDAYVSAMAKLLPKGTGATEAYASGADQMEWALATAEAQAREAAVQINDATTSMLEAGREYRDVFSSDRAAIIGVDQANKAAMACQVRGAQVKKVKLEWVTDGKPCPKICLKLRGKTRNPGKAFVVVNGEAIYHPPAHLN